MHSHKSYHKATGLEKVQLALPKAEKSKIESKSLLSNHPGHPGYLDEGDRAS
ncbi:hypothetical protein [Aerosakkonema funiforme]|uniref:Uncharacterized protein n=1 Tax=Aerosakkonema funiforme FACHB-1375 TaxID=2949571 RepID=A0A926VJP9_9CYAN|nr:hypothetical protein [Aerosakkonema funiforme]MBD2184032.1 hypothetical protein [Aerosakkonema funiforme FACHB-1375]